jgi:hypothetical protein
MQAPMSLTLILRRALICALLACTVPLTATADATAPLTLFDDHETLDPTDDEWAFFYTLDQPFTKGIGYRLGFQQLDPGGAFAIDYYLSNSGWMIEGWTQADPNLGVPALLDIVATSPFPLDLVFAPIFNRTGSTASYSVTDTYIEMDPDYLQTGTGSVMVPEPEARLLGGVALIMLGLIASLRRIVSKQRRRELATIRAGACAMMAAAAFFVSASAAEAGVTIANGPTYSEDLGDLTIEFRPTEWVRKSDVNFEFRFVVKVTNNGAFQNATALYATKDDSLSTLAKVILDRVMPCGEGPMSRDVVTAEEVIRFANVYVQELGGRQPNGNSVARAMRSLGLESRSLKPPRVGGVQGTARKVYILRNLDLWRDAPCDEVWLHLRPEEVNWLS